jgi:hypothetical protein
MPALPIAVVNGLLVEENNLTSYFPPNVAAASQTRPAPFA